MDDWSASAITATTGAGTTKHLPTELVDAPARSGRGMSMRGQLPSLLLNAGAPFLAYQVLTGQGVSSTMALTSSAVFPVIGLGWTSSALSR